MDIPAGFRELTEATGFTAANGPWFEKVEGNRVWRGFMPGPQHANALGIVHGGMLAAFIDAALGSVVYRAIDRRCVTLKLTLDYLTPARVGDWLEATGELLGHDEHVAQVRADSMVRATMCWPGWAISRCCGRDAPSRSGVSVSSEIPDDPPEGFKLVDFARGRPEPTFNTHVGNMYVKRGEKGTRDEFVLAIRVQQNMCNPAGGLHGGMMMTVADLVGTMGGGYLAGLRKFLPTVSMTFDFVAPARVGDWVEGRAELIRQTRTLLFTNIYLTVGEQKILRASSIAKISSGDGTGYTKT